MAGKKLSAKAAKAMEVVEQGRRKTQRVKALVEQYCSSKVGQDAIAQQITRAGVDVGRVFMTAGLGVMADLANQIAMGAKRGGPTASKYRQLRELVGNLGAAIERQEKAVLNMDAAHEHAEAESGH